VKKWLAVFGRGTLASPYSDTGGVMMKKQLPKEKHSLKDDLEEAAALQSFYVFLFLFVF
jgi:hypothetical protein